MNESKQSPDDLLDETQVCEWLNLTLAWARKRRLIGGGPTFRKFGNRVRYRRGDVQTWIDANAYASTHRRAEPLAA